MKSGENPQAGAPAADEDVILLTRVLEEPPTEVVLELPDGDQEFFKRLAADPSPAPAAAPAAGEADDSLADLLASLKELPAEFGAPEAPGPAVEEPRAHQVSELATDEAAMAELVRQTAAEIVERLARELVPQVAERLVAQEIKAWKKRLREEE